MGFWKDLKNGFKGTVATVAAGVGTSMCAVAVVATLGQAKGPKKALRSLSSEFKKEFVKSDIRYVAEVVGTTAAAVVCSTGVIATAGLADGPLDVTNDLLHKASKAYSKTSPIGKAALLGGMFVAGAGIDIDSAAGARSDENQQEETCCDEDITHIIRNRYNCVNDRYDWVTTLNG